MTTGSCARTREDHEQWLLGLTKLARVYILHVTHWRPRTTAAKVAERVLPGRLDRYLGSISRVQVSEPLFALTFDDGPHHDNTIAILAALAESVDALTFGGTKNGLVFGEAVVFLCPVEGARFVRKQAMQLASKMRFHEYALP